MEIAKAILSSRYLPFASAALTLICYYLGWDVVLFYYVATVGISILLLSDDVTPLFPQLLFMSVSVSLVNTPSYTMGTTDYYRRPEIFIQIFIILGLFIAAAAFRLIKTIACKKFKITPIFYGMCGFAATLLLNGIIGEGYNPKNLLFGFILASCVIVVYCIFKDNVKLGADGFEKIAYGFLAFSLLLVIELIVAFATTEGLFKNGIIAREKLIFGWGVYNTYGAFLLMCMPSAIYLAGRKRFGFVYTLYSFLIFVALFFSCSRQAMLGGIVVYPACVVTLFIKGENKFANACVLSAAAVAGTILIAVYSEPVLQFFKVIFDNIVVNGELNGSGRTRIWGEAIAYFKKYPVFGSGFFVEFSYRGNTGLGFMPRMCHNTMLELLSACGIVGLIAYLIHRTQTVLSFFKNMTVTRAFIAITICSLLMVSLVDNHLFNVFPTIIYSGLIAMFDKTETKEID